MLKIKKFFLLIIIFLGCGKVFAQSNLSCSFTGLGVDFGDCKNAEIYKLKISDNGKTIFEPGLRFGAEIYASPVTSLKFVQGVRMDCMQKIAGNTQVMLRFRLFKIFKHSLNIGVGPQVFYRQTWEGIDGYVDEKIYESGSCQYKICWLSGELEYNYWITKKLDLSFAFTHLSPEVASFAVGVKYWITRKSNKCNTCPSFH